MTSPGGVRSARPAGPDVAGALLGGLVAVGFGLVFVLVNSGGLPGGWTPALRGLGAVTGVGLLALLATRHRRLTAAAAHRPVTTGSDGRRGPGRGYWVIVAGEVLALFGGLSVINQGFEAPRYGVAWVAVVVGVHFVALARVWRLTRFLVLGAAMTVLGVAGAGLGLAGAGDGTIRLVSGVASGFALFAAAATAGRAPRSAGPRSVESRVTG